jgi:hypothetical protein
LSPLEIVDRHFNAYNAHDLAAYLATVSESVEVFRHPDSVCVMRGKLQLAEFYGTQRFNIPELRAELVNRIIVGQTVVDHERIRGLQATPVDAVLAYDVADGLIQRVWILASAPSP